MAQRPGAGAADTRLRMASVQAVLPPPCPCGKDILWHC